MNHIVLVASLETEAEEFLPLHDILKRGFFDMLAFKLLAQHLRYDVIIGNLAHRPAVHNEDTVTQNRDAVADFTDFVHPVGDKDDGDVLFDQLPDHRETAVFALVQFLPHLFHGKEDFDVSIPVIVAVLPGDACPIQHQHIQELGFRRQEKEWRLHQESGKGHVAGDRCVLSDGNHFLVTSFRVDPSVFLIDR